MIELNQTTTEMIKKAHNSIDKEKVFAITFLLNFFLILDDYFLNSSMQNKKITNATEAYTNNELVIK